MNSKQILSFTLLSITAALFMPGRAAGESGMILTIDSIDSGRTTIVTTDVAFTLGANLAIRDADGKYLSRSNLRKGMRCEAVTEGATGRSRFVIKELNFCQQIR